MVAHWGAHQMDRTAVDHVTQAILGQIKLELRNAASIAAAAEVCGGAGNVKAAVKMAMDLEDPAFRADRLLQALLLIRRELLDDDLPD